MTEKDEFGFEDQPEPNEQEPAAGVIEEELRRHMGESAEVKKKSPSRLFMLLVLLLVLGGVAGYLYLQNPPVSEPPPPAPPVRQPIAAPPPAGTAEEAMVKTESVPPPPPSVEKPAAPGVKAEAPTKAEVPPLSPEREGKTAETKAIPVPPPPAPTTGESAAPEKTPAPKAGQYYLQAGAFMIKGNLREAEEQIRRLGFEPRVRTLQKMMPMTRLRIGAFFVEEGKARLKSLKAVAPSAFMIREGEYAFVYAGTYQDIDRARREADLLYQQGIRVDEEPIEAEITLSLLSFGDFADRAEAVKVAEKARAAGLEAVVRKDP